MMPGPSFGGTPVELIDGWTRVTDEEAKQLLAWLLDAVISMTPCLENASHDCDEAGNSASRIQEVVSHLSAVLDAVMTFDAGDDLGGLPVGIVLGLKSYVAAHPESDRVDLLLAALDQEGRMPWAVPRSRSA